MHDAEAFLVALTVVLCTAGATTVLFHRLRQPVVLGYILAGLLVGPSIPIPLLADRAIVQTLSELGVILLMFSLGLEFSLRRLAAVGPTAAVAALVQSSLMIWLGYSVGQLFGWTSRESLFAGALIAISSTTIIARAFDEQRVTGRLREVVVGILIVEDLIAILLMAVLTAVATGDGLSADVILTSGGQLGAFLVGLLVVGLLVVPRMMRAIVRIGVPEMTVVVSVGLCFAVALLTHEMGYSVALGAFLAGSLVAESGEEHRVEHLIQPIRDLFGAIFFVSVGMIIDPALIAEHWAPVAVLTAVVIGGKVLGVSLGAFLAGHGTRISVQAGMSLAQIGEFSFIIAGLGVTLGATGEFLYPVAVAVSALTTLTTPWLIRGSSRAARWVDHRLPRPLQAFASLYESWIEALRAAPSEVTTRTRIRRLIRMLAVDAAAMAGILVGGSFTSDAATAFVVEHLGLPAGVARGLVVAAALALTAPFALGALRVARRLGLLVASVALPSAPDGSLDLAAAPRRALVLTIQLGVVLAVSLPLVALGQPFIPGAVAAGLLAAVLVIVAIVFWRTATDLDGHVRAGAAAIVHTLMARAQQGARDGRTAPGQAALPPPVNQLLLGMGRPIPAALPAGSHAVGRTLAQLDLRGLTGATVLALHRSGGTTIPAADDVLRAGDVLVLAGTADAVTAAGQLLGAAMEPPRATEAS